MAVAVRRIKNVKITHDDPAAKEVVRLARDLAAGKKDAGHVPNVELRVDYRAGWSDGLGEWFASIPVAPASARYYLASANGHTADEAVKNLLSVVQKIPLKAWD